MIEIDGSYGEGGGQILRTSLTLAALTGQPVRIARIRAGRPRPGLMRQHLAAVEAAAALCGASVEGAAPGSDRLTFRPARAGGAPPAASYHFAIGTAGSTTLVLQTVLLPLLLHARAPAELLLEGGTHNPHAPPFDFLDKAFLPLLRRMGARVDATLERHGFCPAGGGRLRVRAEPLNRLEPLDLTERGAFLGGRAVALSCAVPPSVGRDEACQVAQSLGWPEACAESLPVESAGPGNAVYAWVRSEHADEVFTAFGERGLDRAHVARQAAGQARRYLDAGVPVGPHLADQLLLPLALAGRGRFRTVAPTAHTRTNIHVIQQFMPVSFRIAEVAEDAVEIEVHS